MTDEAAERLRAEIQQALDAADLWADRRGMVADEELRRALGRACLAAGRLDLIEPTAATASLQRRLARLLAGVPA